MKKTFILFTAFLCFLNLFSQVKSEDIIQTVTHDYSLFYSVDKYPDVKDMIEASKVNKLKYSKVMRTGDKYRVIGLPKDSADYFRYVKIRRESDGKIGWYQANCVGNRECFLEYFPNFRKEYLPNIKSHTMAPGMTKQEVYVCTNVYFEQADTKPYPMDKKYELWGDGLLEEVLFYNGELCLNRALKDCFFYYSPIVTLKIDSVQCSVNEMVKTSVIDGNKYSDKNIDIEWFAERHTLPFKMKNKTNTSMKLIWDDMALKTYSSSSRVIHKGIKLVDKEKEQTNNVVSQSSNYSDLLMPTNDVKFNSSPAHWSAPYVFGLAPLSPNDSKGIEDMLRYKMEILFTIKNNDITYEYVFFVSLSEVKFEVIYGPSTERYNI